MRLFANLRSKLFSLSALSVLVVQMHSCSGPLFKSSSLPHNRPKGFTIVYSTSGGMLNLGENTYISEDSCRYTYHYNQAVSVMKFKFSNPLLDSLYKIFRDNRFDKIEMYEEKVYDRGGESITIYWDKITYTAGSSGMSFVKDKWKNEWNNVSASLMKITMNELEKFKIEIPIYIDKNLNGKFLTIRFNQEMVFNDKISGIEDSLKVTTRQLPGNYYTSIQLKEPYKGWINTIDINKIAGLKLTLINDELKCTELPK